MSSTFCCSTEREQLQPFFYAGTYCFIFGIGFLLCAKEMCTYIIALFFGIGFLLCAKNGFLFLLRSLIQMPLQHTDIRLLF
mmetsp:Transcript_38533/g.60206  ORF Transcript_38533/g.60206 Transcript_38533/m.60206 type:complete len:81 (-) Transcript_38533:130-372(-)